MCLAQSAGQKPTAQLMEMQNQAPAVGGYVRQLLTQQPGDSGPVHTYVSMLRQLLTAVSGTWHGCGAFFGCVCVCVYLCVCVCVCVHACVCVCAWMRVCGWNGYWNKSQQQKVDAGEENSPAASAGTPTRDFLITRCKSVALPLSYSCSPLFGLRQLIKRQ